MHIYTFFFNYNEPHLQYNPLKHKIKNKDLQLEYNAKQDTKTLTFNQKNARAKTINQKRNKFLNEKS